MRITQPTFGEPLPGIVYQERPAAYAVLFAPDGQVGVVDMKGQFYLPGGGSDPGETPEETVHRELQEELTCTIRLLAPLGSAIQYFAADGVHYRMTATFYHAEFTSEPGVGEHTLLYVPFPESEPRFRHECQAWAVREAWKQTASPSRIEQ